MKFIVCDSDINVRSYITTIQGTNINIGVPQYKNC